jgi:hypothetical protein
MKINKDESDKQDIENEVTSFSPDLSLLISSAIHSVEMRSKFRGGFEIQLQNQSPNFNIFKVVGMFCFDDEAVIGQETFLARASLNRLSLSASPIFDRRERKVFRKLCPATRTFRRLNASITVRQNLTKTRQIQIAHYLLYTRSRTRFFKRHFAIAADYCKVDLGGIQEPSGII